MFNSRTVFIVEHDDNILSHDHGGIFSTMEKAKTRRNALNKDYVQGWTIREIWVDYYDDRVRNLLPPTVWLEKRKYYR